MTIGEEAKPQAPFTMTPTPKPKLESSDDVGDAKCLPGAPFGRQTQADALVTLPNPDIAISRFVFLRLVQCDGAEFLQIGRRFFESFGAPNRLAASEAAEVAMKCRRVSIEYQLMQRLIEHLRSARDIFPRIRENIVISKARTEGVWTCFEMRSPSALS